VSRGVPIAERGPGWSYRPDGRPPSLFGAHQPGIVTPRLDHLVLAAFYGAADLARITATAEALLYVPPALAAAPEPSEPRAYTAPAGALAEGALVWLASSMPVRDVESFWPAGPERVRFLSNRGANGIDGTLASAAGAARATGSPVLVALGELALLHDLGGLLAARRAGIDLTVLCVDNGGGGIFDFLAVAASADPDLYEAHVATPSGLDLRAVAALAGMEHRPAGSAAEVRAAVAAGPGLIEVRTDRSANVAVHREIFARVHAAL